MSILHVHAPRRDKHTVKLDSEAVFACLLRPLPSSISALSSCTTTSSTNSSTRRSSFTSISSSQLSPAKYEYSPLSASSSFSSASFTASDAMSIGQSAADLHDSSTSTRLRALSHTFDKPRDRVSAIPKTMDERSSETRDDGETRDSAISGLSILSDDTDEFYRRSREHLLRNRQHLKNAASNPQAFRRARQTQLSMGRLDRKQATSDSSTISEEDAAKSLPTRRQSAAAGLERGKNVPKEWGRKGRHGADFLRRINSTGDMDAAREHTEEEEMGELPDLDSPLSSRKRSSRMPGPRVKRSIDDLLDRERRERELSEGRLSPAPGSPEPRGADAKEIESLRDKAVTSSRLAEVAEVARRSFRMPGSLASAFRRAEEPVEQTMDSILGQLNSNVETSTTRMSDDKHKSSGTVALSQNDATASGKDTRPRQTRTDSRDLLKRFARASTASPSPSPAKEGLNSAEDVSSKVLEKDELPTLPTPDQTPPRKSNSVRHSVHGGPSGSGSLRASPSISKVPTRSSSLRSLRSPPRNSSKRVSQSSLRPEDVPIPSVEEGGTSSWANSPDARRVSLPPVQEPATDEQPHPDPLRSHPVSPAPEQLPFVNENVRGQAVSVADIDAIRDAMTVDDAKRGDGTSVQHRRRPKHGEEAASDDARLLINGARTSRPFSREQAQQVGGHGALSSLLTPPDSTVSCPSCNAAFPAPTLWTVTLASLSSAVHLLASTLLTTNHAGFVRPSRTSYYLLAFCFWLFVETIACKRYCPTFCTFWFPSYTDMEFRSPRFPFVLPWKLVLEPTQSFWRPPYRATLAFIEPLGWGLFKRTLWASLKAINLDWLFGPGDERLEGLWDWPWWWTYLYGAEWGAHNPNCVMCPSLGS